MEELRVVPIHKQYKYLNDCIKLLNSEWPRSFNARLSSLEPSCDSLPACLVMIYTYSVQDQSETSDDDTEEEEEAVCTCGDVTSLQDDNDIPSSVSCPVCSRYREEVVGHSKVSRLCCVPDGCLVESVLIHKDYRGRGWGKYLMEQTEQFIKNLGGVTVVYLTTTDKQTFYRKIGYKDTEPIPLFGNAWSLNSAFKSLFLSSSDSSKTDKSSRAETSKKEIGTTETKSNVINIGGATIPIPPPMPTVVQNIQSGSTIPTPSGVPSNQSGSKIPVPPPMPSGVQCNPNGPIVPVPPPMPSGKKKRRHLKKNHVKRAHKTFMVKYFT